MKNKISKKYKMVLVLGSLILYILLSLAYVFHYYNVINWSNIITQLIIQFDLLLHYGLRLCSEITKVILDKELLKLIIILMTVLYILKNYNVIDKIVDIVKLIKKVDIKGIEIVMDREDLEKDLKKEDDKINELSKCPNNKLEIDNAKMKKEVLQLMLDSPRIVELIDQFVNFNCKKIKIPRNQIPYKYKLVDIEKIFVTEVSGSTIKILSIRDDIRPTVIEVFNDLVARGIIYSLVNK